LDLKRKLKFERWGGEYFFGEEMGLKEDWNGGSLFKGE